MGKRTIVAPQSKKKVVEASQSFEEEKDAGDSPQHKRLLMKADLRGQFVTLADHIAESNLFIRNFKFLEADTLYPDINFVDYRFVTKMYPHAKKGMLLVDEPRSENQTKMAYEKQKKLKKLGYRHVVIEEDTTLYDCLMQLGEL